MISNAECDVVSCFDRRCLVAFGSICRRLFSGVLEMVLYSNKMNLRTVKKFAAIMFLICGFAAAAYSQTETTVVEDSAAAKRLLGRHLLSLQWISWDYFGRATVTKTGGIYRIKGGQNSRQNGDYLKIDGVITRIGKNFFEFFGIVETRVSHINGGEPCRRDGMMEFRIKGNRKYWRLADMDNPCDAATDYVDVYFR